MLTSEDYCHLPVSSLQPDAPVHEVAVPMADVSNHGVINLHGYGAHAFYDAGNQVWRLRFSFGNGPMVAWRVAKDEWVSGSVVEWQAIRDTLPPLEGFRTIQLPPLPVLPLNTRPIPKKIHHIWVGTSIPNQNIIDNLSLNGRNSSQFTSTLHTDVSDELLMTLKNIFRATAPGLVIANVRDSLFFEQFRKSRLYAHYINATTGPGLNYSAASDILRYPLSNYHGGLYMDVDDHFIRDPLDMVFQAAPNDLLLGGLVKHADAGFEGYNSSIFATHPNNPVLNQVIEEMATRCELNRDFFLKPRPRFSLDAVSTSAQQTYSSELFRLTGPQVLNDVLARERPDYYNNQFKLTEEHGTSMTHVVYDPAYVDKLTEVQQHYFPFFNKAEVAIGAEHSWLTT